MNLIDKFHNWRRKRRWNKQYKSGRWDNLKNEKEAKRYFKIVELIKEYGTVNPTILDLGSGEGVLNKSLNDFEFSYFLGIDFSEVSIKKALKKKYPNSEFKTADLHSFIPEKFYDIIIFNEAFYYVYDKERQKVLDRMMSKLNPNGIIINSIYKEGLGCWEYFNIDQLKQLDFVTVTTEDDNTYWKIGVYQKQ